MKQILIICLLFGTAIARWQWTPFFDGTSFDGWFIEGDESYWKINAADSAIEGFSTTNTPYTMAYTDREFDLLTVKYQIRLTAGCSGFFFRAQNLSSGALVRGMQVEAKFRSGQLAEVGSLYCHDCGNSSGWRVQHTDAYSASISNPINQYQQYYLTVDASNVYVNVNGSQATGETDINILNTGAKRAYAYNTTPEVNTPGKIGLQIHGGQPNMDVRFRNMAILQACTEGPNADQNLPQWVEGTNNKHPAVYEHNETLCEASSGCTDAAADNHNASASTDDGSCGYTGCGDATATNDFCITNPTAFPCVSSNGYTRADISGETCTVGIVVKGIKKSHMGAAGEGSTIQVRSSTAGSYEISIFDVLGNKVVNEKETGPQDLQFQLKPGIYFVKVSGEKLSTQVTRVNLF